MKIFERKKDGNRRSFYFCGKKFLSYKKKNYKQDVWTHFTTLNYYNTYLNGKLVKSTEKYHIKVLKYLEKYLYATKNDLDIEVSNELENPIWQIWFQGEDSMPPIVKICVQSIKKYNPDRKIILLTKDNIKDYVSIPDYIEEKYKNGIIPHAHYADLVRFMLLYKYGGTWIDATVFMTGEMPEFISNSKLFVFKDIISTIIKPATTLQQFVFLCNCREFGTWINSISFMHAQTGSKYVEHTLKCMLEYWKYEDSVYNYLFCSYLQTLIVFNDEKVKEEFINANSNILTVEYGMMQTGLFEHFNEEIFDNIKKMTPIHKLTYKNFDKNAYEDSLLNYILKSGSDDAAETLVCVERERERERERESNLSKCL